MPAETSAPATKAPKPQAEHSQHVADPTHDSPIKVQSNPAAAGPTHGSSDNSPDKTNGDSGDAPGHDQAPAKPANDAPDSVATKLGADAQPNKSKGVAAILSMFLPQDNQAPTAGDQPGNAPASDPAPHAGERVVFSAGSGVHTAASRDGAIIIDGKSLADGQATVISGQTISAESGRVVANGVPQHPSAPEQAATPQGIFTVAGKEHTAVRHANGAVEADGKSQAFGAAVTVADGSVVTVVPEGVRVDGTVVPYAQPQVQNEQGAVFTVAGQSHTAVQHANGAVEVDGQSHTVGAAVTVADGSVVTLASEGVRVGGTVVRYVKAPGQNEQGAVITINGHAYNIDRQSGSLRFNGAPVSVGDVITTNGDVLTIGSQVINAGGATIPLPDGQPAEPTVGGANVVIAGKTMMAVQRGDNVLIDGTTLHVGQVATVAGTELSVASNGVVVGTITATFHDMGGSNVQASADAITIDGTVYSTSALPDHADAVVLAGHTLSKGGPAATIDGQVVTYGPNGISVENSPASITVNGEVYSASTLPDQSDAVLIAGHTLSKGGPAATIDGQVVTYGPNGISVVNSAAMVTATPTGDHVASVVVIDGITYTASPVPGSSGIVVLDGQTLSIGGSGVTIDGHLVTKGSGGISVVGSTSRTTDDPLASSSTPSTDTAESYTSTVQEGPAAPSESEEGSASRIGLEFGVALLGSAMLVLTIINL